MLELENIVWSLPTGEEILKGVSLEIPDGKLTVITGPNIWYRTANLRQYYFKW